ncbi:hypothetical protein AQJ54_30735 [Streptomyces griseorubiginosus]|uniref:Uncharacterized protein n=1 Tax=Streptomyces griseorubiginosus TaxID=67304 RepID=A0A101RVY0_9ACTN|nr:hypothetical protein AQJ54_30735 [Streptomyces griseorubiginosus]
MPLGRNMVYPPLLSPTIELPTDSGLEVGLMLLCGLHDGLHCNSVTRSGLVFEHCHPLLRCDVMLQEVKSLFLEVTVGGR